MRLRTFGGLWVENRDTLAEANPRPRGLALLAMLAAAGPKGMSRDRAFGILWPDSETERARHALSQTIYSLRKDLGVEVVLSSPELRLDPRSISSDVAELQAAVRASDWRTAAELYTGPFLEGFYLADAPEFERWAETTRAALTVDATRAIELLAKTATSDGRHDEVAELYRRLTCLDPVSARYAIAYMESLAAVGQRTEALAHGKAYAELIRREFEADPDRDVADLMARLREPEPGRPRSTPALATPAADVEATPAIAAPEPTTISALLTTEPAVVAAPQPAAARTPNRRFIAIAAMVVAAVIVVAWFVAHPLDVFARNRLPVVAVGRIRDLGSPDSVGLTGVSSEMLATSLGRVPNLQVIANSRMLELMPRDADTSLSAVGGAARRAGATEMIEGELIPLPDHTLRLDVRRVDVDRGIVRRGYQVTGKDRIALFDSVAVLIAGDFRLDAPARSLADVSTRSPLAYRLYEEGLRAFFQFDAPTANRLFRSAMHEDSTFAMAAYYAWRSAVAVGDTDEAQIARRAMQLASRASDRDRLLIRTHIGFGWNDLHALAAAETLATRFSRDPEALIRAAEVIPDVARATDLLNRSIVLDSAAGTRPAAICRLCDAMSLLVSRYEWADSTDAAERAVQRWIRLRPDDAQPWSMLSDLYIEEGRRSDAMGADIHLTALGGPRGDVRIRDLIWSLRTDDIGSADAACVLGLPSASAADFLQLRWWCSIGLRMQGRYRDANALAREARVPGSSVVRREAPVEPYLPAIVDLETGRGLAAADEFAAITHEPVDTAHIAPGTHARETVWRLTLTATAAAEGGDTARARRLLDSIETVGRQSLFPRDPVLHHFVRGILAARGGNHALAVRELRSSIASPTFGFTRANYELGHELMALGRPAEAIPVVRAALRGGIEGSNLYVTRTALHEELAQLFDAAGARDSAAAHYAVVERAWHGADPSFAPRYRAAQAWLARYSKR